MDRFRFRFIKDQIGALTLAHYSANGFLNIVICFGINQATGVCLGLGQYVACMQCLFSCEY